MGRKRKSMQEWVKQYEDLEVIVINENNNESVVVEAQVIDETPEHKSKLICKYCKTEFDYENSHISSRIPEHMSCILHNQNKPKQK